MVFLGFERKEIKKKLVFFYLREKNLLIMQCEVKIELKVYFSYKIVHSSANEYQFVVIFDPIFKEKRK